MILPGHDFVVYFNLQIIPMSLDELKTNIRSEDGTDMDVHSHLIPAITMVGKETGLSGEGILVPQVSDSLAKDSGLGILPMILAHGGNAVQVPATSIMKQELFNFLRAVVKPVRFKNLSEWDPVFTEATWPAPPLPSVMWPAPDVALRNAEEGRRIRPFP